MVPTGEIRENQGMSFELAQAYIQKIKKKYISLIQRNELFKCRSARNLKRKRLVETCNEAVSKFMIDCGESEKYVFK